MRRPSWPVCIATDTVTRQWCCTVHHLPDGNKQSHAGESYQRATSQGPIIRGGSLKTPGLATQRERGLNCHQTEYSRTSVDCSVRKGAGAQRPHCAKGRDPRTLASRRHWLPQVVVATTCSFIQRNAWSPVVHPVRQSTELYVDFTWQGTCRCVSAWPHLMLSFAYSGEPLPSHCSTKFTTVLRG